MEEVVDSLSTIEKAKIYQHYVLTTLGCVMFEVVDKLGNDNWKHGWGEPTKEIHNIAIYVRTSYPMSYEDFIKIRKIDYGENWKKEGWAQRVRIDCNLYDWRERFNL